jgi:hypothetical protein
MNNAGTSPGGGPWDHYERWQRVLNGSRAGLLGLLSWGPMSDRRSAHQIDGKSRHPVTYEADMQAAMTYT